ncbi:MAG: RNA 3'-terminal phosphate cyclase [archaeon]|nr:RNA 3'-terminal phosphate cyclase [archaeon]MCP8305513.1 RNA 3'-terminal phosphate cyclase [archaeon]
MGMLRIDGGEKSGSGTILRLSVALAAILNEELHIYNIRKRRSPSGLRPQHLEAVLTAAKLCNAEVKGAELGAEELWFKPNEITGGELEAEIGTAGSIPMLLLTILPLCAYAKRDVYLNVSKGGTDVRNAPTINYLQYVLLPTLGKMGLEASLKVHAFGYYPIGMGDISLSVQPCRRLKPLKAKEFGKLQEVRGLSVCTFLKEKKVAERQARATKEHLEVHGYRAEVDVLYDTSNPLQKGSSLILWAKTDRDVILGGDAIGELRKTSEVVGHEAAENLLKELRAKSTVDVHLADMLIPYLGLAEGESIYLTRSMTEHLDTNIWLTEKILGVKFGIERVGNLYRIRRG